MRERECTPQIFARFARFARLALIRLRCACYGGPVCDKCLHCQPGLGRVPSTGFRVPGFGLATDAEGGGQNPSSPPRGFLAREFRELPRIQPVRRSSPVRPGQARSNRVKPSQSRSDPVKAGQSRSDPVKPVQQGQSRRVKPGQARSDQSEKLPVLEMGNCHGRSAAGTATKVDSRKRTQRSQRWKGQSLCSLRSFAAIIRARGREFHGW